jgi:hypothetical protein
MAEARTNITLKGKEFPFYKTNRGQFDFCQSGFSTQQIAEGNEAAMYAHIYFWARACAKRENKNWPYTSLDAFVDDTDDSILEVYTRLAEAKNSEQPAEQGEA